jgi:hypothetical protein
MSTQTPHSPFCNPFFDMFKPHCENSFFKNSNMNVLDSGMVSMRRSSEAMSDVMQTFASNVQIMIQKNVANAQENFANGMSVFQEMVSAHTPEQAWNVQKKFVKNANLNMFNQAKDGLEMFTKSFSDMLDICAKSSENECCHEPCKESAPVPHKKKSHHAQLHTSVVE